LEAVAVKNSLFVVAILLGVMTVPYVHAGDRPVRGPADPFSVECKEPIAPFTLGKNSNPTKAQVEKLCKCIWDKMGGWEKETSQAMMEGREPSALYQQAFPARFGQRIKECGGMGL